MKGSLLTLTLGTALFASGCTAITNAGNSVLESVGLASEPETFEKAERVEYITTSITPENEYYIGRAVAARIFGVYKEYKNPALREYVSRVLSVVVAASNRPTTFKGYRVVIIESDELNAISAPGGFIFITTGMLRRLPDEDSLAAVLAHEVSHVEHQHGIQAVSKEKLSQALDTLGVVAASLSCGQVFQQALIVFATVTDDIFITLVERGYSRDQEFEADGDAIRMLQRAGYNPYALTSVLQQLKESEGASTGGWFATHPPASDRLDSASEGLSGITPTTPDPSRNLRYDRASKRFLNAATSKFFHMGPEGAALADRREAKDKLVL